MPAAKVALAPIVKTQMARRITRSGLTRSPECWGAQTADGIWDLTREDDVDTNWLTYHRPSVADGTCERPVGLHANLRACRAYIASGQAQAALDRMKAHQRGEHVERDSWCVMC
jgi:hypothetical protein